MIALRISRLRLRPDIEADNKHRVINLNRKLRYRVAKVLKVTPEHELVTIVYDALIRGVKEFRTTDEMLLNMSIVIENEFGMKVINAAKGETCKV
jgi:hypothetical protein